MPAIAGADDSSPIHAALRVGTASSSYSIIEEAATGSGRGPLFDLEAGYRIAPHVSVTGFFAYDYFRPRGSYFDFGTNTFDEDDHVYDLGIRVQAHLYGAFVGLGFGYEGVRQRGHYTCITEDCHGLYDEHDSRYYRAALYEVHAGYALPIYRGIAAEIFAEVTYAGFDAFSDDGLISTRLALGVSI